LGQRAIDLEDLYPNRIRFQVPNLTDHTFLGGADLNPARKYPNCKKVMLYLPQDKYSQRRSRRDAKVPGKASQQIHEIDAWLVGANYDWVIDVSPHPKKIAQSLISKLKGAEGHGN
jgi:hypothetical protein